MVIINIIVGFDPVEDPNVPKDYTLSVPIFKKKISILW